MPGKYGDLIKAAKGSGKPDNQEANQPDEQKTGKPDNQMFGKQENQLTREPEVNLCVKVPKSLRQHWAAEAKRQGITMTEVIVEALKTKFGEP